MKSRLHGGWKGTLFNTFFVGTFNALPRAWVRRFGWHLLAFCTQMKLVKAHASVTTSCCVDARPTCRRARIGRRCTRSLCERHRGIGADGVIVLQRRHRTAHAMDLLNADGSYSEVSGNGVRCLAAWLARSGICAGGRRSTFDTDAGVKRLELLGDRRTRALPFAPRWASPSSCEQRRLDVDGTPVDAITLRVGNPQCVVLGEVSEERLHAWPRGWPSTRCFPKGSNVELATVEAPGRVRILIWERGVGPTEASGTGACAAAVAAIALRRRRARRPGRVARAARSASSGTTTGSFSPAGPRSSPRSTGGSSRVLKNACSAPDFLVRGDAAIVTMAFDHRLAVVRQAGCAARVAPAHQVVRRGGEGRRSNRRGGHRGAAACAAVRRFSSSRRVARLCFRLRWLSRVAGDGAWSGRRSHCAALSLVCCATCGVMPIRRTAATHARRVVSSCRRRRSRAGSSAAIRRAS